MTTTLRYKFLTALKSLISLHIELGIKSLALDELNSLCKEFSVTIDAEDKTWFLAAINRNAL